MSTMLISQFAEHTGVPATTLRFYESAGLAPAGRTDSGYRVYGDRDVDRVAFIQTAKHVGLPLGEIRELLAVWEHDPCAEVRAQLRPKMAARLDEAATRTAELAAFTDTLRHALAQLDDLPDRAEPCDAGCGFLAPQPRTQVVDPPFAAPGAAITVPVDPPIACSLDAADHGERVHRWQQVLVDVVREPGPADVRLRLPIDRVGALAELAAAEQHCCPFYEFDLHLRGTEVILDVGAPAAAAEMVRALFGDGTSAPPAR
ncbi:MerR family transcriptional regulator (plasmid) [Rhodococcus pyridinivorans]|nr:MerR family transcriptional regulator [Rhodococcus pyridinivorans]UTM39938.1 MerR family transcriptional regulator [Rhodococcus pyridinivorans]